MMNTAFDKIVVLAALTTPGLAGGNETRRRSARGIAALPNEHGTVTVSWWLLRIALGCLLMLGVMHTSRLTGAEAKPLVRAHAHNDYLHARPLFDALEHGFCSMEADIHLVDGALLVAHDLEQVQPGRTLEALYLEPLRRRIQMNGGRVYQNGPTVILLIDIKSEAESTYAVLHKLLERYSDILTTFQEKAVEPKPVLAVISGNRPRHLLARQPVRYAALDGRLEDLAGPVDTNLVALISDNWTKQFQWQGTGPLPEDQKQRLADIVAQTHAKGLRLRFWAVPDHARGWQVLATAGVDLINTDDLAGLRRFLEGLSAGGQGAVDQ